MLLPFVMKGSNNSVAEINRKAFTLVELIFVIVIVAILAAIAIPKLSATRSDAQGATIVSALATCINDAGNEYMMQGLFNQRTQPANSTEACRIARTCFSFTENDSTGTLQVNNLPSSEAKCIEAQRIASENRLLQTTTIHF